jgi:polysaccharide chain length determinant protein (PEP-CTERM system associated)
MNDLVRQLIDALRGIWIRRWIGLGVAWLVGIGAAAFIALTPDKYEASARVYVDTESVLKPLMSGLAIQPNVGQEMTILTRTLISRPNLEKLVRMTDLDLGLKSTQAREALLDDLSHTLEIRGVGRDNLYTISYRDTTPAQAQRVVQSLLAIFVESGMGNKRNDSQEAVRFINEQITAYEQRLTEAENRLKEFRLQTMDMSGATGPDYFTSLAALAEELEKARIELSVGERSRDALRAQLNGEEPVFLPQPQGRGEAPQTEVSTPDIDARLEPLRLTLDNLLRQYTDQHPDVVNTRRIIRDLEKQREDDQARLRSELANRTQSEPAAALPVDRNPVYQQLKLSMAQAEAQVAALRARVSALTARYAELRQKARLIPEVESRFAQLNRDYAVEKQNYQNLVTRRESAMLSGEMGASTGFADFRIIDPPRASPQPVAPNRKLALPLAFAVSIAAGIAAAFIASQIMPTFHDSLKLKQASKRPVLGVVSLIPSKAMIARRRRAAVLFFSGVGGLLASFAGAMAFLLLYVPRM